MDKPLIYIVEDDENIRELVKYALSNEGFEVVAFENAEDMLAAAKSRLPRLIVLDIMLPGMDGLEALKEIRSDNKNVNIRVIMLTAKNGEINKVRGLDAGADDYLTKPFSVLELTARVRANLRKYSVNLANDILSFSQIKLNLNTREVFTGDKKISLTLKEFELLKALMQSAGNVVERENLLLEVWGYGYIGETRTLDIHIKTLREKLGEYGDCIVTIRGVGYILKEFSE